MDRNGHFCPPAQRVGDDRLGLRRERRSFVIAQNAPRAFVGAGREF